MKSTDLRLRQIRKINSWLVFFGTSFLSSFTLAQADFSIPDTVCNDNPVFITNVKPPNATSYRWSFCSGNASYEPDGFNMGNQGNRLNQPRFITVVHDDAGYYSFITNSGNGEIARYFYGTSLSQFPLRTDALGNFGVLTNKVMGIQVIQDNGTWYGFVANADKLVRLNFGSSPMNAPTSQVISLPPGTSASGLAMAMQGNEWVGFCTNITGNSLFRFRFVQGLGSDPLQTNLGNIGQLNQPTHLVLAEEKNQWYAFICNIGSNSLTRINFGASLLNQPEGTNLVNISGLYLNSGISLINECGTVNGFVTNCRKESNLCIVHLTFKDGLGGAVKGYNIPNRGSLNMPYGISEFVRQGDTLFAFVANWGSTTITRMLFPSCSGLSQTISNEYDPSPISYPDTGNYNILLTVNKGLPSQSSQCKNIVVMPQPALSLGPDRMICRGKSTVLDAGAGDSVYDWSTGAKTRKITVDTPGTYTIRVINFWKCEAYDTINITLKENTETVVDTTICQGMTYWAQNAAQTASGTYYDTFQSANHCDSVVTTNLTVEECPVLMWFPDAFTPDGDGLNDEFQTQGVEIVSYSLQIFDRWGAMIFESNNIKNGWDGMIHGKDAPSAVYTYICNFVSNLYPGIKHRKTGIITLIR
jgi:gliding motility-associated-like protein